MERTCAPCSDVFDKMQEGIVAFTGPKGSGKTTTLRETYHFAQAKGAKVSFIDVALAVDETFTGCSGDDYW